MTTLMAYADAISVRPGDTIGFKVSCDGADHYDARIVRLLSPEAGPDAPPFRTEPVDTPTNNSYQARTQPLRAGSWAMVPAHPLVSGLQSFSVAVLIWPTLPGDGRQTILGTWNESSGTGFGLMLNEAGEASSDWERWCWAAGSDCWPASGISSPPVMTRQSERLHCIRTCWPTRR